MSTGDLGNNWKRLQVELKSIKHASVDLDKCKNVDSLVDILRYAFLDFSPLVAHWISTTAGFDLVGRSIERFIDGLYKLLITKFTYNPQLRKDQFLTRRQFVERKILTVIDCIQHVKKLHNSLVRMNPIYSKNVAKKTPAVVVPEIEGFKEEEITGESENDENVNIQESVTNMPTRNYQKYNFQYLQEPPAVSSVSTIEQRRRALSAFHKSLQVPLYPNRTEFSNTIHVDAHESVEVDDEINLPDIDDLFVSVNQMRSDKQMTLDEISTYEDKEDIYSYANYDSQVEEVMEHENEQIDYLLNPDEPQTVMLEKAAMQIQQLTDVMSRILTRLDRSETILENLANQNHQ